MIQLLNLKEAKDWAEKNLMDADNYMFPVNIAVKRGLLKAINENTFAVVDYEQNGCVWHLDEVRRLSNKEMEEQDLYCRYRYRAHVTKAPEGYKGATTICAGFMVDEETEVGV